MPTPVRRSRWLEYVVPAELTVSSVDETRDTSQALAGASKWMANVMFGESDPDFASFFAQYGDHPERFANETGEEKVSKSSQVQPGAPSVCLFARRPLFLRRH